MAGTAPTRYRYDVFLSHSSADKPVVRELAERLKAAGLRVWFDEWLIQPGDLISAKLEEGLEHSAVLLLCMSANAFGSDWVSLEGHTAIFRDPQNLERRFVPLRLDGAPIKAMLRGYAYIDWQSEADRQAQLGRLLQACGAPQRETGEEAAGEPASSAGEEPAARGLKQPRQAFGLSPEPPAPLAPANPASAQPATAAPSAPPQYPRSLQLLQPGPALSVAWSPDGARLLSGGHDKTVRLWEAASGRELAVLEGHKGPVLSVAWSPDGAQVLSGGDDGTVRLWEAASGRELAVLEGHMGPVLSVGWSPDGSRLLSGWMDGTVRLWEAASGRKLAVLEGHKGPVLSVGWSPDGARLLSGGDDGTVRLWEAASGRELAVLKGHKGPVLSVGWSPDGARVLSGGDDGTVRLWEAASGRELAVLEGHKGPVWDVGWSPDGARLLSGGRDTKVRLWEAASGRELAVLEGHKGPVLSVAWSPDGAQVLSGGDDGTVRLWEAASGRELAVLKGHKDGPWSVGWSPDSDRLLSGGMDGTVLLWEAASGRELAVLEGHKGRVWSVGWSPDGARLLSGGHDGTVRLWEAASGRKLAVLEGHKGPVWDVGWSPDGARLLSGGRDTKVRLWEAASGRQLAVLKGHKDGVVSVGWSPDGARVLSGGMDGTLRLWEAASGRQLAVLEGHKSGVMSVGWSPDGVRLLSGGHDGTVRLWEAASGRELAVLEGHKGSVLSVGWSPDGARVLSGGQDGTVRLWEAASGRELAVLEGHKGPVWSVGWSPDGGLWAAGAFGLVLLWPADLQASPPPASDDEASSSYTNAKVLVVGESGAGKTGLTRRLATGTFEHSVDSTVGAWCTQWPLPQPAAGSSAAIAGEPQREVWLWDFGGQADQRLIHQLFLDRAALVLLLFNAERDAVIEGLRDWQNALRRTLAEPPPQLLVAARIDAGFGASRSRLQNFAAEHDCLFLETSARTGRGCPELIAAIAEAIPWHRLPRHTSPRLFQRIKAEILRLRDGGVVLLTYKDLRERLLQHYPSLDDATLRTVLGLLDGPGVLKQLDFGDYVLLKPEVLSVYGQAVVRALKQAEPQLGSLPVGTISAADLPFASDQPRLEPSEEPVLLAELERQLQERKICLRQGGRLVFPSFCGLERPASPALPPRFMSYSVRGWLDEIHASLVVSLEETRVFQLQELWRDAAEYRTVASAGLLDGQALAVQLQRHNVSEGMITVHTAAGLSLSEQAQFAQLIHSHLRDAAVTVERRRHWLCPHCHAPKGNEAVLMSKLERDGELARVTCDACDRTFPLFDDLERLLADTSLRRQAEAIGHQELPLLTSRRKGKLLLLEVGARLTSANQKWQEINPDEDDGIDMQVEFTDDDGNGTGRYLYLQLKAGPSHLRRLKDGREIFTIKKPRWIHTWTQQPGPVMLVIGREAAADPHSYWVDSLRQGNSEGFTFRQARADATTRFDPDGIQQISLFADRSNSRAFPDVRWMEISSVLQRELAAGRRPEQIRQIEFVGESLDMASVLQWRRKILATAEAAP